VPPPLGFEPPRVVVRLPREAVVPVLRVERLAVVPLFFAALVRDLAPPEEAAAERVPVDFFAVERFAVERLAVEPLLVERLAVDRFAVEREEEPRLVAPEDDAPAPLSSSDHLPDSTRCAASATASAISEPRRVALETADVAACDAVSAASSPASRILRRAAGLAAIAAAAALRPAASISRLIAALAILSIVLSFDFERELDEDDERDEDFFLVDFAIANLPAVRTERHMKC
jgi:hypothetical protein